VDAFLYATTLGNPSIVSVTVELDDVSYVLSPMPFNTYDGCCDLLSFKYSGADLVSQVAAKYVSDGPGVIDFTAEEISPGSTITDGVALVVIFSNPAEPFRTIAILDGSLASSGEQTLIGLAEPLDKTVPGFEATLALGIGFSAQDQFGAAPSHQCGEDDDQGSTVDINGVRLTSCAGNFDDSVDPVSNGNLFTVGGVGDVVDNPDDPLQAPADGDSPRTTDDELYDLEPLLAQGITVIDMDTTNASFDDLVFLSIFAITAQASVGEICDDGIDNDEDGSIDEGCQIIQVVGGELLPIDATALLVAGSQANAVWILSALAVIGSVAFGTLYITTRRN
jgi:hypothetical protein